MNKELAIFYFPHTPEDDLFDLWEERLFEQKQFFLTHPPLRTVWESKLRRLRKAYTAFLTLTQQEIPSPDSEIKFDFEPFSEDFLTSFNLFHQKRNQYKQRLLQVQTIEEIDNLITEWLDFEKHYAKDWSYPPSLDNDVQVLRSKEPDPMYLLEDLKKINLELNLKTFQELKMNYNILPETIQKEVKRLTLLAK